MAKTDKKKKNFIGPGPLDSYEDITKQENRELKKLTIEQAVKRTEVLLRNRILWKK